MIEAPLALLVAVGLDVAFGEPPNPIHPVVWMGHAIGAGVKIAPKIGPKSQLVAGLLLAIAIPGSFASLGAIALLAAHEPAWLRFVVTVYLLKSTFALRALGRAAFVVRDALATGSLASGRDALRSLCSRDPSKLAEPDLVAATIESVAENASDSFVAPLFYFAIFGVPGALFYRAVNTLDAMIGYRGRYEYLGKASARLDDVLNLVPARITAALLLLVAPLFKQDARAGWRIFKRDARRTESPNAGRPMAAMAGLLRVELVKEGHYRLGDASEALSLPKIDDAWRVVCGAAACATLLTCAALWVSHAR